MVEWRPVTAGFIGGSAYRFESYQFSDVREWFIQDIKASRIFAVGIGAGLAAIGQNRRASVNAAEQSGLYIQVKDIDNPEWQIKLDEKRQKKWFEILRQFINEG